MGISKVTRNYQVSIPKDVRERIEIKEGDVVLIKKKDETIIVKPLKEDIVEKSFGSWEGMEKTGEEYTREVRDKAERREKKIGL